MSQSPPLSQQERHHLDAAEGWLGLGCWDEAQKELEAINPERQRHPQVLQIRWAAYAAGAKWLEALEVAAELIQSNPEDASGWVHRSYCLHELKRTEEARDNLLRIVDQFKTDTVMRYNLACYECQLGRLEQARQWLQKACTLGGARKIKEMALADPDMAPLRNEIAGGLRGDEDGSASDASSG